MRRTGCEGVGAPTAADGGGSGSPGGDGGVRCSFLLLQSEFLLVSGRNLRECCARGKIASPASISTSAKSDRNALGHVQWGDVSLLLALTRRIIIYVAERELRKRRLPSLS